jgi:integrase
MSEYVRLVVFRNGLYLYYANKEMDNFRFNLKIPLTKFSQKEITQIKALLKKGRFPSMLEPYRSEIDAIRNKLNGIISDYKKEFLILPPVSEFRRMIKSKIDIQGDNFIELLEEFIKDKIQDFVNSPASIKDFISFKNSIIDYQNQYNETLSLTSIDRDFIRKYYFFLQQKREINKGFKTKGGLDGKTIKKRLDTLKQFAKWHSSRKKDYDFYNQIISILSDKTFDTSKITAVVKKVTLSLEQIKFLQYVELKENSTYCKVRDMFVFVCQTGLRFSDLTTLKPQHIEKIGGQYSIYRQSKKTKKKFFRVELSDWAYIVLKKYNFNLNLMSNQKSNDYLKKLLSNYDIFREKTKYINTETNLPHLFYELVSFHQGRRSFITNLLDNGFSIVEVMERTDHLKVSTLEKYVSTKGYGKRNILNLWDKS